MKAYFNNLTIKGKLMVIVLLTSCVVLFVSTLVFVINEAFTFRMEVRQELGALASIIGENTSAALVFNDPASAEKTLASLGAQPHILSAQIFTKDARVFAEYFSKEIHKNEKSLGSIENNHAFWNDTKCIKICHFKQIEQKRNTEVIAITQKSLADLASGMNSFWNWSGYLVAVKPITLNGQQIGTIVILSDLSVLLYRLKLFLPIVLGVLIGASFLAYYLSSKLQRLISLPILRLAETMKAVSANKDYTVRADIKTNDELGLLNSGFNNMLEQIQQRDEKLERYNEELEGTVFARTEALSEANEELEQTITDLKKAKEAAEAMQAALNPSSWPT
jgi:two-component system, sensor histidine kinase